MLVLGSNHWYPENRNINTIYFIIITRFDSFPYSGSAKFQDPQKHEETEREAVPVPEQQVRQTTKGEPGKIVLI